MASLINFLSPLFPPHPKFLHCQTSSSSSIPISSISITTTKVTKPQSTNQNRQLIGKNEQILNPIESIIPIVHPSLAYSNTLFFNSAYNVQVLVEDNEPEERLLNRFRREVMRAGVIQECKRRRFFENKQEEKKRKAREAAKRNSRRRRGFQPRGPFQSRDEASKVDKKDDDNEDNWEMPAGGSPF